MKLYTIRLHPHQDLKDELLAFTKTHAIKAGFIVTCVGSLKRAKLRLADEMRVEEFRKGFEITSLVGTLSEKGAHLHIALADHNGTTIGGHLMTGCEIHTTAEIVIGVDESVTYVRELDELTGFDELKVTRND